MDVDDNESSHTDDTEEENADSTDNDSQSVYLPGQPLKEGQSLVCDESAYVMLHETQTGSPCLSFDIINHPLYSGTGRFPMTSYVVAGTQAPKTHANSLLVLKMSNMNKTNDADSEESDDESSDDERIEPDLKYTMLTHLGCVNRVRTTVVDSMVLAASWSELGRVNIWDITSELQGLEEKSNKGKRENRPIFSFKGHFCEGYGLDWNSTSKGVLASGDCKCGIHIWHPSEGSWQIDQRPLVGHTDSVEDLQWSPNEPNVLASCSVDKSIRIWDVRVPSVTANKLTVENAHEMDVNVIHWNRNEPFIVSGGDDGVLHIWDLRQFKTGSPVASFKHHTEPVTTVEWHPTDSSVFASGGADNQIALWDIAVEKDTEISEDELPNLPSQLLFIHLGQTDVKELHWQHDFDGVLLSTAESGFNIFKTISV